MRKKLFNIIEPSDGNNVLSSIYDYAIIFVITISILPLCFKQTNNITGFIDIFCVSIFISTVLKSRNRLSLVFGKN